MELRGDGKGAERPSEFVRVELGASGQPVHGGKLEESFTRPVGQQSHDLVEVLLRVQATQSADA